MPNDDAVGKGGWGGENVFKSDGVILVRSLRHHAKLTNGPIPYYLNQENALVGTFSMIMNLRMDLCLQLY